MARQKGDKKVPALMPETAGLLAAAFASLSEFGIDEVLGVGTSHVRKQMKNFDSNLLALAWMRAEVEKGNSLSMFAAVVSGWSDQDQKCRWIDRTFADVAVLAMNLGDLAFFEQWVRLHSGIPGISMEKSQVIESAYHDLRRALENCSEDPWHETDGCASDEIVVEVCTRPVHPRRCPSLYEILLYLKIIEGRAVDRDDEGVVKKGVDAITRRFAQAVCSREGLELSDGEEFPGNW